MITEEKNKKWLKIKEISRTTGIAENTLRRYAEYFNEFIPTTKEGRTTKYSSTSVETFLTIYNLYNEGESTEEIRNKLTGEVPRLVDVVEEKIKGQEVVIIQLINSIKSISDSLEGIRSDISANKEVFNILYKQQQEIQELKSIIEELKNKEKSSFWRFFKRS